MEWGPPNGSKTPNWWRYLLLRVCAVPLAHDVRELAGGGAQTEASVGESLLPVPKPLACLV